MKVKCFSILLSVCLLLVVGQANAGYVSAPADYTVQDTVFPIPYSWSVYGFDILPSGNFVAFVDHDIVEITRAGVVSAPLFSFTESVYGSFVKVWGDTIYFGESSTGAIRMMGLDGSNPTLIGTVANAYDLEFNSLGQAFISANPGWMGQKILFFDGSAKEVVTGLSGYSGPLAFDASDNLLYGTAYSSEGDVLLRFAADSVAGAIGGDALTQADGQILADISAPFDMVVDSPGNVFFTSGTTLYRIADGYPSPVSLASSEYFLTTLRHGASDGSLYLSVNGVTSGDGTLGVITSLTPIPEPGGLVSLVALSGLFLPSMLKRRRFRSERSN